MGRPTKSRSLYAQMAGRATRPLPGIVDGLGSNAERTAAIAASRKPACLILDFVGNSGRHKLMTSADILGGNVSDEAIQRVVMRAKKNDGTMRIDVVLSEEEEKLKAEKEQARLAEEARRARLVATAKFKAVQVNPFDVLDISPQKERGWDKGRELSQKQKDLLLKQGINADGMPYSQAKQLLNEIFRRFDGKMCSFRQAKVLKKFGYPADMGRDEAKKTLDALAANRWRRPV